MQVGINLIAHYEKHNYFLVFTYKIDSFICYIIIFHNRNVEKCGNNDDEGCSVANFFFQKIKKIFVSEAESRRQSDHLIYNYLRHIYFNGTL